RRVLFRSWPKRKDSVQKGRLSWQSTQRKIGRSERIRTSDPLLPKQVRYQAALRSDREGQVSPEAAECKGESCEPIAENGAYQRSATFAHQALQQAPARGGHRLAAKARPRCRTQT